MTTQQERLRAVAVSIRTKPTPLSDFIPLLTQTADHIDKLVAENERLKALADSEGTRAVEYLRRARHAEADVERLRKDAELMREALTFYAQGEHFYFDDDAWDTVSGEPQNFWCDEAGTATVEDGSIAKLALDATTKGTP